MIIKEITERYEKDFYGKLLCEFCGGIQDFSGGCNDGFWHNTVLPNTACKKCSKSTNTEEGEKLK